MPLIPKAWRSGQGGVRGELAAFLICLALGVTVVPLLVWLVGSRSLGAYTNGGALEFWRDDLLALMHLGLPHWIVALGPYAALWAWRAARGLAGG
jgi:hypothetical protein